MRKKSVADLVHALIERRIVPSLRAAIRPDGRKLLTLPPSGHLVELPDAPPHKPLSALRSASRAAPVSGRAGSSSRRSQPTFDVCTSLDLREVISMRPPDRSAAPVVLLAATPIDLHSTTRKTASRRDGEPARSPRRQYCKSNDTRAQTSGRTRPASTLDNVASSKLKRTTRTLSATRSRSTQFAG